MSKHAPGPWAVVDLGYDSGRQVYVADNTGTTVCDCDWSHTDDECEANARLIAAAPEMYEALKEAEAELYQVPPADNEQLRTLEIVRAAIAKAEGK